MAQQASLVQSNAHPIGAVAQRRAFQVAHVDTAAVAYALPPAAMLRCRQKGDGSPLMGSYQASMPSLATPHTPPVSPPAAMKLSMPDLVPECTSPSSTSTIPAPVMTVPSYTLDCALRSPAHVLESPMSHRMLGNVPVPLSMPQLEPQRVTRCHTPYTDHSTYTAETVSNTSFGDGYAYISACGNGFEKHGEEESPYAMTEAELDAHLRNCGFA